MVLKRRGKRIAVMLLAAMLLTGCGNPMKKMDASTIYIKGDGSVESISIETFDKEYYHEEELKAFIEEEVKAQQTERGEESIKIENFDVEKENAVLNMSYAGTEDYVEFTGAVLEKGAYQASVKVEDIIFIQAKSGEAISEEPSDTEELSYIKIQDPEDIQVLIDGEILYYSEGAEYKDKNLVKIPAGKESMILYK